MRVEKTPELAIGPTTGEAFLCGAGAFLGVTRLPREPPALLMNLISASALPGVNLACVKTSVSLTVTSWRIMASLRWFCDVTFAISAHMSSSLIWERSLTWTILILLPSHSGLSGALVNFLGGIFTFPLFTFDTLRALIGHCAAYLILITRSAVTRSFLLNVLSFFIV